MVSRFPRASHSSHLLSILPSVASSYFRLVVVCKFIKRRPLESTVYFMFIHFLLLKFSPKQWYHISPAPPIRGTSPRTSNLLPTLSLSWLLCVKWFVGGHLRTRCIEFLFFCPLNCHPKRWDDALPYALTTARLLSNISSTASANYWLVVVCCH